jgi:transcriptional regulator with XRE-family HTH domain
MLSACVPLLVIQFVSGNPSIEGIPAMYTKIEGKPAMDTKTLIDLAKANSGMSFGEMATELGYAQQKISEWRRGSFEPSAGVLAYFAEKAGLPVLVTVAEIEETFDPRFAPIWAKALGNLHAATLAATPTIGTATSSKMTKDQTIRTLIEAVIDSLDKTPDQVQIKAMMLAVLNAFPAEQPTIATAPQIRGANARGVAVEKPRLRKSLRT